MKTVTVVQARMTSSRLPQKVMLPILHKPLLARMLERVETAKQIGTLVVATSTNPDDDEIKDFCKVENYNLFRGHLTDLLDRHYQLAVEYKADAIVKIPSDCPLIDPEIIDKVISKFIDSDHFDYVSNLHPATYPDGNDVEIMSFAALECAWKEAKKDYEREHTTPFIWENPELFSIGNVEWETGLDYSTSHRWTIDYAEDYEFIRRVYEELYSNKHNFGLNDILNLLKQKPEIAEINSAHYGKYWYQNHLEELNHINEYKNKFKTNEEI